jgi:2-polyprenyl-3-methyl-5-hydroxy-6-metoxy-1,4-benzoquinol methylase
MTATAEEIYSNDYFNYLHNRSSFRRKVRTLYLNDIKKYCIGRTIDFGCGVGELLKTLPEGSIGFEVNKVVVGFCKKNGLNVDLYVPEEDNYDLKMIGPGEYETFTMNHVLEHLESSSKVITKIFESCNRLGIKRIVFTVPGHKGYKADATHQTFINMDYLIKTGITDNKYYELKVNKYFPVNSESFSKFFTHNELRLVFDKRQ